MIAIRPILYSRGAGGVPANTAPLPDVASALTSYQHTISATGGFESLRLDVQFNLNAALDWLNNLMASIVCYGPNAEIVWEGFLSGVSLSVGDERVDLSLADMANAVKVRYQPAVGAQTATAFAYDTDSIAAYGQKNLVYGGSGMTTAAATALRDALLNDRRQPKSRRAGGASTGDGANEVSLSLTGTGWYYALDWITTFSATTATAVTTTQLQTLITAYNAVNTFYSTTFNAIAASGVSDTQYIEEDTLFREKIERLLSLGDSAGQRLAYGVYEDRTWVVQQWAGATPSTIDYTRSLGDGRIYNAGGALVEPWQVRPDTMYQVLELIDPSLPTGVIDQTSAFYVERVTCSVDQGGAGVRLEPAKSGELDVLLSRIK